MQEKPINKSKQAPVLRLFSSKWGRDSGKKPYLCGMKKPHLQPLSEERGILRKVVRLHYSPLHGDGLGVRLLLLVLLLFFSCQRHVETPLQIPYAESVVESRSNAVFALYLLSEVEDTIANFPDSVKMRYKLAQTMALNAKGENVDSLLPPLLEWFEAHGPARETARIHHMMALSLLQRDMTEEASKELACALETDPSYMPSRFMKAYLCLYTNDFAHALEHFMLIENYEGQRGSIMQGAWAMRNSLAADSSDFAQALQGDDLETARQMLTDMNFCLRYFQEHPDDDKDSIIYLFAQAHDSLLHARYNAEDFSNRTSVYSHEMEETPRSNNRFVYFILAGALLTAGVILKMTHRHWEPTIKPEPVFNEIVQRMEQLADNGQQPAAEEWEQLRIFVQSSHPTLLKALEKANLTRSELCMCLLSAVGLRQKQVSTLLDISPQNLRNQRLRLLARMGMKSESVQDFTLWMEGLKS